MRLTCGLSADAAEEAAFLSDTVNQPGWKNKHVKGRLCFTPMLEEIYKLNRTNQEMTPPQKKRPIMSLVATERGLERHGKARKEAAAWI